jgi:DNA replication protein DnaC
MQAYEKYLKQRGYKSLEEAVHEFQRKNYGARYVGSSLSELEIPDQAAQLMLKFMNEPKNILLYHGSAGCGKTKFCASVTEWLFKTFNTFRIHKEFELLAKLREIIGFGTGDYARALDFMIDDDLVILDDVGSGINPEKVSYKDLEWRREVFFNFLDSRYSSQKPTIITSNFTKDQFETVYSERIVSRLFASENSFISIYGEGYDKRAQGK